MTTESLDKPINEAVEDTPYFPITNNATFGWGLYKNPEICKELLKTVLKIDIQDLDFLTTEQELMLNIASRSVRLDVYATSQGKVFDIEMQLANQGDLLKRMRLYQASIDGNYLDKGAFFTDLPDSYLIFFCGFDPFGKEQALYEFETVCTSNSYVEDKTGARWLVYNFKNYDNYPSTTGETKELLKYFNTQEVGNTQLVKDLDKMVEDLNNDTKWVNQLVTLEQKYAWDVEYARRQAKAEGIAEGEAKGEDRLARLYTQLDKEGRAQDFARAVTDEDYRQGLYKEFGI